MRWTAALLVLLAACAAPAPTPQAPALRTDAGPVAARFPAVGTPVAVWWIEERLGTDGAAPGPSDYRTTAVVRLAQGTADGLAALTDRADAVPDVPEAVRPHLPLGPFRAGAALDDRLAPAGTATRAWLDPAAATLVVVSTTT